jgi:OOP family OmpA-OmpF porin
MDTFDTRIRFKTIGCGLMLAGVLALGGCGSGFEAAHPGNPSTQGRNLDAAKLALNTKSDFNGSLARDYYAVANRRATAQDWTDSDYFARKSLAASAGGSVAPENAMTADNSPALGPSEISASGESGGPSVEPHNWLIPGNADPGMGETRIMSDARAHLVSALDKGGRTRFPTLAARTQALYDCWLERSEHEGAKEFKGQCNQGFVRDFTDLNVLLNPPSVRSAYFDYNSATLTPEGQQQVKQAAALIKDGTARLTIIGKADRSGSNDYNMKLSAQRAAAVRDAFIANGIAANRIDVRSTGENQLPVATKDGAREGKNRVVQIETLMPSTQVAELTPN